MTAHNFDISQTLNNINPNLDKEDEFSDIPLCINDIISICIEYNKLGYNIQSQIQNIIDMGADEAIKSGVVKLEALPHIKNFLEQICSNPYFGEAISEAEECIMLIKEYLSSIKIKNISMLN